MAPKKKVLILCQAPADASYALHLYQKHHKEGAKITIAVANVVSLYNYFSSLTIDAEVLFIPQRSLKNPFYILQVRIQLQRVLRGFKRQHFSEIYFFSILQDYVTAFFIEHLKAHSKVTLIDHYGHRPQEGGASFLERSLLKFLSIIFSTELKFCRHQGYRFYFYPYTSATTVIPTFHTEDLGEFLYRPQPSAGKATALLYETNAAKVVYFKSYDTEIKETLDKLTSRFQVYIKGHPRLGISDAATHHSGVIIIPEYIPGELIATDTFNCIFGIDSAVIAHLAVHKRNVFSLLPLFTIAPEVKKSLQEYLQNKSQHRLIFLEKEGLTELLKLPPEFPST